MCLTLNYTVYERVGVACAVCADGASAAERLCPPPPAPARPMYVPLTHGSSTPLAYPRYRITYLCFVPLASSRKKLRHPSHPLCL